MNCMLVCYVSSVDLCARPLIALRSHPTALEDKQILGGSEDLVP